VEDVPVAHRLGSVVGDAGELLALVNSIPALRWDGKAVLGQDRDQQHGADCCGEGGGRNARGGIALRWTEGSSLK